MLPSCPVCNRLKIIDSFAGQGGAGRGYMDAGFCVDAVDKVPDRKTYKGQAAHLDNYPRVCAGQRFFVTDAVEFIVEHGHEYAAGHGSPTCTGYSRGTAALPDRFERYDRLIPAVREAFQIAGIPYVIENVADARPELIDPVLLCGRMFNLKAIDDDGTELVLDRHRLFETSFPCPAPEHRPHDTSLQVAGAYRTGRRDKVEAREVRGGGYVPPSLAVLRELLGTPWMTEAGCFLSIPPAYTQHIGRRLMEHFHRMVAAA